MQKKKKSDTNNIIKGILYWKILQNKKVMLASILKAVSVLICPVLTVYTCDRITQVHIEPQHFIVYTFSVCEGVNIS